MVAQTGQSGGDIRCIPRKVKVSSRRLLFFFNPDAAATTAVSANRPSVQTRLKDCKLLVCVNIFTNARLDASPTGANSMTYSLSDVLS
jgi:hypothetical protein